MPIRSLTVLWCLYADYVQALARFEGHSMNTSKQSMMTATLSPNEIRKHLGLVRLSCGWSGHKMGGLRWISIIVTHLDIMWDKVNRKMPKLYAKSCSGGFNISLIKVVTNSWNLESACAELALLNLPKLTNLKSWTVFRLFLKVKN